ncbi:MAG: hypothetical protein M0Q23_03995 [Syntrophales bacterium]|jgi:hypothetical protein|nr:hypothetical protein [Syntrophales bacterium]MCK9527804.1 hypothetical protein [Syntrophales bacterium]MDX9922099.1 hypothetical protein [Syntrophales bacterium]
MEQEYDRDTQAPENPGADDIHRNTGQDNPTDPEEIVDLVDVIDDERPGQAVLDNEALRGIVVATAERLARELFPDIAASIIREEIEKLKRNL